MNSVGIAPDSNVDPTTAVARIQVWKVAIRAFLGLAILGMIIGFGVYQWAMSKTREIPDFYLQAKQRMPRDLRAASRQLESDVKELTTQVGRLGSWEATFDEVQINAWLVDQLPHVFRRLLPKGVHEPRVMLQDGKVWAAARYKDSRLDTVVSFHVDVQLTAEPNVLAIAVRDLKAGALPLPLGHFRDQISKWAARDALEVRWDTNESDEPIALVTVPSEHQSYLRTPVIVESVVVSDGALKLSGHTGPDARLAFQPRGPVFRLASLRRSNPQESQCDLPLNQRSKL